MRKDPLFPFFIFTVVVPIVLVLISIMAYVLDGALEPAMGAMIGVPLFGGLALFLYALIND